MKKKLLIILSIMILIAGEITMSYISKFTTKTILKTAITRKDLEGKKYIICKMHLITEYEWQVIEKDGDTTFNEPCWMNSVVSYPDVPMNYYFKYADNKYVFYFTERNVIYAEDFKMEIAVYEVTGWDILYPVKHNSMCDLFKTKWHIIKEYDT